VNIQWQRVVHEGFRKDDGTSHVTIKKIVFYRRILKNKENSNDGKIFLSRISNWVSREFKLVTLPLKLTYSVHGIGSEMY
jgi:hypothetical protein